MLFLSSMIRLIGASKMIKQITFLCSCCTYIITTTVTNILWMTVSP